MARTFPGGADTTTYLSSGNAPSFDVTTNINLIAIVRPAVSLDLDYILDSGVGTTGGVALASGAIGTANMIAFRKNNVGHVNSTTPFITNVWQVVLAFCPGAANIIVKRLRLDTGEIVTETVANATGPNLPAATSPLHIGHNKALGVDSSFPGDIARVSAFQREVLSNSELYDYVRGKLIPGVCMLDCLLEGRHIEFDFSPNNYRFAVNGSALISPGPFDYDQEDDEEEFDTPPALIPLSAFQPSAFQSNAFQIGWVPFGAPPASTQPPRTMHQFRMRAA